ncbi:MAG: FlaD/FlaE family flagellar protein, partial [Halobaculum sp.]
DLGGMDESGDLGGMDTPGQEGGQTEPADTARQMDPSQQRGQEGGFDFVEEDELSDEREKPYLHELPGDYVGDLLIMEWLEYLVEEGDTTDAVRAINYYERVEWLSPEVAEQLKSYLSGFGEIDRNLIDRPGTAKLDLQHHTQSLKYIMQLTNATAESVVLDRWPRLSEGRHGNQR